MEKLSFDRNGQWNLEKSNYGPTGAGAYSIPDNVKRKKKNTGEQQAFAGPNQNVKDYGGFGGSKVANIEDARIKRQNKKQPVKQYSPAEIEEYKRKQGMAKSESLSISPNGQWSITSTQ